MNPLGKHVASGCTGGRVPKAECQPRGSHCSLMVRRSVRPRWGEGTSLYLGVCLPARHIATVSRRQECRHIQLKDLWFLPLLPLPRLPWVPGGASPESCPSTTLAVSQLPRWSRGAHGFTEETSPRLLARDPLWVHSKERLYFISASLAAGSRLWQISIQTKALFKDKRHLQRGKGPSHQQLGLSNLISLISHLKATS